MTGDGTAPGHEAESAQTAVTALHGFAAAAEASAWLEEPVGISIDVDLVLFHHRKRFGRRARRQQGGGVEFELTWRGRGAWPELL
jgi:hypothetical protein